MKELILVRHGKSSWDYDVQDTDRPLKERGVRDAHRVAEAAIGEVRDVQAVFSSPANRALHTCLILMREVTLPFDKLTISSDLYDFSGSAVRSFVHSLDDSLDKVLLFGHNHALTHLANHWGSKYVDNVPTTGLVYLTFEEDRWESITYGTTKLMLFPRDLRT